jgi:hypothetical protein
MLRREEKAYGENGTGGVIPQKNSNWQPSRINL